LVWGFLPGAGDQTQGIVYGKHMFSTELDSPANFAIFNKVCYF
jgi:hypothetical protein